MPGFSKMIAGLIALGIVVACAPQNPLVLQTLPKGEEVDVRKMLAANQGKIGCIDYEAATNSCASLISVKVSGNSVLAREVAAIGTPDGSGTQRVEVLTRSKIRGNSICAKADDISVAGRDEISIFLLDITRGLVEQVGGSVCGQYFQSGRDFVVSSVGANGSSFPPGDSALSFVTAGSVSLRAQ